MVLLAVKAKGAIMTTYSYPMLVVQPSGSSYCPMPSIHILLKSRNKTVARPIGETKNLEVGMAAPLLVLCVLSRLLCCCPQVSQR